MKRIAICTVILLLAGSILAQDKVWKTRVGVSFVRTTGNSETETLSGKCDVEGTGKGNRYILNADALRAKGGGQTIAEKGKFAIRVERTFTGRLFGFITAAYLRDTFAGYNRRLSVGPGLGLNLILGERHKLKGRASTIYFSDVYTVPGSPTDAYATAKTALDYEWTIKEHVSFKAQSDAAISLEDSDKAFINGEAVLQVGINSRLAVGLAYALRYQNRVPVPQIKKTDTTFTTSLIVNLQDTH